jgi:hypothetical protein
MLQLNKAVDQIFYVHLGAQEVAANTTVTVLSKSVMTNEVDTQTWAIVSSDERATQIQVDASLFALGMYLVTIKSEDEAVTYATLLAYVSSSTGVPLPEPTYEEYSQQVTAVVYGG